jgi:hypothetical protein
MKMPNFGEAHWGAGAEQSMQRSLALLLEISRSWGKAGQTARALGELWVGDRREKRSVLW